MGKRGKRLSRSRIYKPAYRIVAFAVATVLMVICFPGTNRFSYEYELKRPWRYEDVIAPFDFPILKPEAEVAAERDSLLRDVVPYFVIDTVQEMALRLDIHAMVHALGGRIAQYTPPSVNADTLMAVLESALASNVFSVCRDGIIDVGAKDGGSGTTGELMLIKANVATPFRLDDLTTPRQAYNEVVRRTSEDLRAHYGIETWRFRQIVSILPVSELLEPNVHFDEGKTQTAVKEKVENIVLYSGRVMSGQLIVRTGDIVTPRTAQLLASLKAATDGGFKTNEHELPILIGQLMIVGGLMLSLYLFLRYFRRDYFNQIHFINFILVLMTFTVCAAGLLAGHGVNISFSVPYVVLPVMLRIFTDARLGMYVHIVTVIIVSFFAFNSQLFIFTHVPAGLIACIALYQLNKRIQIFRTAVYLFVFYSVMYSGYLFWQRAEIALEPAPFVQLCISTVLFLLTYPLIYLVEKIFGFVSDVSLMEMTDGNNLLLRQLSEKAPGTFQHSMQVANLGQEVAYRIGGNALLVRAGALYHDIGKVLNPLLFTENQAKGMDPHKEMTYEQSASLIKAHVTNGIAMAKKHNLPNMIRDIIATHHGTTMTRYFYLRWCSEHPEETPDIAAFTYPGPRPRTKEQAIIMMADAVEAASKSMSRRDDNDISTLVDKIVDGQMAGGQFQKAPITFAEIDEAKEVLKEKLKNIYHVRIQYPDNTKD